MKEDSSNQAKIGEMVRRIVEQFNPEKIILFGSYARGTAGKDSDVDLLVVMPVSGSKRAKQVELRLTLHDIRLPKEMPFAGQKFHYPHFLLFDLFQSRLIAAESGGK